MRPNKNPHDWRMFKLIVKINEQNEERVRFINNTVPFKHELEAFDAKQLAARLCYEEHVSVSFP